MTIYLFIHISTIIRGYNTNCIVETCGFHLRDDEDDIMEENNSSEDELITQELIGAKQSANEPKTAQVAGMNGSTFSSLANAQRKL